MRFSLRHSLAILSLLLTQTLFGQVSDPNLTPNPGFESGGATSFTDWSYYHSGTASGSVSVSTSAPNVYSGSRSAVLTVTVAGDVALATPEPGIIPVVPNTAYRLTAQVKSALAGQYACGRIMEWHTGGVPTAYITHDTWFGCSAGTTAWALFQGDPFVTQPGTDSVSIRIMGNWAPGTFYVDEVRLTRSDPPAYYVTSAPAPSSCPAPSHGCLTPLSSADLQLQFSNGNIDSNAELDRWAAIYQDVRGGGSCAAGATQSLFDRLTIALAAAPITDGRQAGSVDYFRQWLAGGIVTHIFGAAKEIDYHSITNNLAPLLAQVKSRYAGAPPGYSPQVASPQDPSCGLGSLLSSSPNSCMDDHSLTASGYAWIAAFESQRLRDPQPYLGRALNEINYALAPMSANSDSSTHGGGPCVESLTAAQPNCSGTVATYTPGGFRVIGYDHNQENPAYGLGLMPSIASACVGVFDAGSTCGTFSGWNATAAVELLRTAQQRSSLNGSDWDQSGCVHFDQTTRPCDDSSYLGLIPAAAYKPRDFSIALFYQKRGLSGGYQSDVAYQFNYYCDPRTVWTPPYDKLWGPNRYTFFSTLSDAAYSQDTQAPRVKVTVPSPSQVLTGAVVLAADAADNARVKQVSYYVDGGISPFFVSSWPFNDALDTSTGNVDGSYNLLLKASDDAGNVGTSGSVPFVVSNPRVNAGGSAFVDTLGNHWSADYGYSAGYTASTGGAISGADIEQLYQSVHWNTGPFSYTFPVANGLRTVKLRFAEFVYMTAGTRVFNVAINGTTVLSSFDVVAVAGAAFRAVDRSFTTNVTGQQVVVTFTPVVENPEINAIEIH